MTASIEAQLFDGRSAAARHVRLRVEGDDLVAEGEVAARWPLRGVRWPERTRHGQRVVHLPGGGWLECDDSAAFDAWTAALGHRESWLVRAQQRWPATLAALGALVVVLVAGYVWGVPLAARAVLAVVPAAADRAVGDAALRSLDDVLLKPSKLPPARQAALRRLFDDAAARAYEQAVPYRVEFRSAPFGANAFALPGGAIVVTDAFVELLNDRDDALVGVFAHELGHVRRRHGMRLVVQATIVAAAVGAVVGDFSTVLAGAPALLAQAAYSRDLEREADAESVHVLRRAGYAPAAMAVAFERLRGHAGDGPPIGLASHPEIDERIRYFRDVPQR